MTPTPYRLRRPPQEEATLADSQSQIRGVRAVNPFSHRIAP
jgi:hypothetical protein